MKHPAAAAAIRIACLASCAFCSVTGADSLGPPLSGAVPGHQIEEAHPRMSVVPFTLATDISSETIVNVADTTTASKQLEGMGENSRPVEPELAAFVAAVHSMEAERISALWQLAQGREARTRKWVKSMTPEQKQRYDAAQQGRKNSLRSQWDAERVEWKSTTPTREEQQ